MSSHPKVAELGTVGVLTAKHPGRTEVSLRITLGGVTVQSNPVTILVTGPENH